MPKAKLKLEKSLTKRVKVAAHFSDSKLGPAQVIGANVHFELNHKGAQNLVEFGRLIETVTGDEQIEEPAKVKEEAAPKKTK